MSLCQELIFIFKQKQTVQAAYSTQCLRLLTKAYFYATENRRQHSKRYKLGQSVAAARNIHTFKAVNHQHTENRRRQRLAEIGYIFRCFPFSREEQKRQKPGQHGSKRAKRNGYNLFGHSHSRPPDPSSGCLNAVSSKSISPMVGSMNDSAPNIIRQRSAERTPITAV